MALGWVGALAGAFSMRRELTFIACTLIGICLLPIVAVVLLTQTGISIVSEALASGDPQTGEVTIHDPATGQTIGTITTPRFWPISGRVSLEFGVIHFPYQPLHTGIDIAGPTGDPIVPFMDGTVVKVDSLSWGYGKYVVVDHGNHISSYYAHFNTIAVTVGQPVEAGVTVLGGRGSTGWSTGPHLHFETRVFGIPVNPRTFLSGNP
ncbi:MAG: M23 family metallopeptidase [Patescibacteria group bacterium]|jgi:murein DD-endopeptidase MepM/ murein hydrolase activator NlpD